VLPLGSALAGEGAATWDLLADQDRFYLSGTQAGARPVEAQLWVPALGCALWISR